MGSVRIPVAVDGATTGPSHRDGLSRARTSVTRSLCRVPGGAGGNSSFSASTFALSDFGGPLGFGALSISAARSALVSCRVPETILRLPLAAVLVGLLPPSHVRLHTRPRGRVARFRVTARVGESPETPHRSPGFSWLPRNLHAADQTGQRDFGRDRRAPSHTPSRTPQRVYSLSALIEASISPSGIAENVAASRHPFPRTNRTRSLWPIPTGADGRAAAEVPKGVCDIHAGDAGHSCQTRQAACINPKLAGHPVGPSPPSLTASGAFRLSGATALRPREPPPKATARSATDSRPRPGSGCHPTSRSNPRRGPRAATPTESPR